jgi:hypothetical protein
MSYYETVAASQTDQVMGTTGASGDTIDGLVCIVTTVATSGVQLKDGTGSAFYVLPDNVASVGTYPIPLGLRSASGGWKITTGAGVAVVAVGSFR